MSVLEQRSLGEVPGLSGIHYHLCPSPVTDTYFTVESLILAQDERWLQA